MNIITSGRQLRDLDELLLALAKSMGYGYRKVQHSPFVQFGSRTLVADDGQLFKQLVLENTSGLDAEDVISRVKPNIWYLADVTLIHYVALLSAGQAHRRTNLVQNAASGSGSIPLTTASAHGVTADEKAALTDENPSFYESKDCFFQDVYATLEAVGGDAQGFISFKVVGVKAIFS